jgi:hypothetical protein
MSVLRDILHGIKLLYWDYPRDFIRILRGR